MAMVCEKRLLWMRAGRDSNPRTPRRGVMEYQKSSTIQTEADFQPVVATPYIGKSTDSQPSSHGCLTQMRNPLAGCSAGSWPSSPSSREKMSSTYSDLCSQCQLF